MHWNGSAWTRVPSRGGDSNLSGVAAHVPARNAWAVGFTTAGSNHGLILHWNGITWTRVPVVGMPKQTLLLRVAAVSARDAWAVGTTDANKAVILRWNGTTWRQVKAPIKSAVLLGITALSGRDAWIAGTTADNLGVGCAAGRFASALTPVLADRSHPADGHFSPVILHWNGHRWQLVKNPSLPACGRPCSASPLPRPAAPGPSAARATTSARKPKPWSCTGTASAGSELGTTTRLVDASLTREGDRDLVQCPAGKDAEGPVLEALVHGLGDVNPDRPQVRARPWSWPGRPMRCAAWAPRTRTWVRWWPDKMNASTVYVLPTVTTNRPATGDVPATK